MAELTACYVRQFWQGGWVLFQPLFDCLSVVFSVGRVTKTTFGWIFMKFVEYVQIVETS